MACPTKLFSLPFALTLTSTDNQWRPIGPPVVIVGAAGVDLVVTVKQVSGLARVTGALELIAARPLIPGSVTLSTGGYINTQTSIKNTYDLSGTTAKMFAQLGVVGNLASGLYYPSCAGERPEGPIDPPPGDPDLHGRLPPGIEELVYATSQEWVIILDGAQLL